MSWTDRLYQQTPGLIYADNIKYSRGVVIHPILPAVPGSKKVYEVKLLKHQPSDAEHTHVFSIRLNQTTLAFDPSQDLLVLTSHFKYVCHTFAQM
jgi:hypothetical protein